MEKKEDSMLTEGANKLIEGLTDLAEGTTAYDVLVGLSCFIAAYCEIMSKRHSTFDRHRFIGDFMRSLVEMGRIVDEVVKEIKSRKSKKEQKRNGKAAENHE